MNTNPVTSSPTQLETIAPMTHFSESPKSSRVTWPVPSIASSYNPARWNDATAPTAATIAIRTSSTDAATAQPSAGRSLAAEAGGGAVGPTG